MSPAPTTNSESSTHPFSQSGWLSFLFWHTPTASPCCLSSQSNLRPNSFDVAALVDLPVQDPQYPHLSCPCLIWQHVMATPLAAGLLVAIASLVHTTPSMPLVLPLAAYPLLPLSHCIPLAYSSSYRTPLPDATNASCLISTPPPVPSTNFVVAAPTPMLSYTPSSSMDVAVALLIALRRCLRPPSTSGFPRSRSVTTRIRR